MRKVSFNIRQPDGKLGLELEGWETVIEGFLVVVHRGVSAPSTWTVSDRESGILFFDQFRTRKEAIEETKRRIQEIGPDKVRERLAYYREKYNIGDETMKKQEAKRYQFRYSNECCTIYKVSPIVPAPSEAEITRRSLEWYEEDALMWNDDLLKTSPEDGKMSLHCDYSYFEGTIEEIKELFAGWNQRSELYYIRIAEQLKERLEDMGENPWQYQIRAAESGDTISEHDSEYDAEGKLDDYVAQDVEDAKERGEDLDDLDARKFYEIVRIDALGNIETVWPEQ